MVAHNSLKYSSDEQRIPWPKRQGDTRRQNRKMVGIGAFQYFEIKIPVKNPPNFSLDRNILFHNFSALFNIFILSFKDDLPLFHDIVFSGKTQGHLNVRFNQ